MEHEKRTHHNFQNPRVSQIKKDLGAVRLAYGVHEEMPLLKYLLGCTRRNDNNYHLLPQMRIFIIGNIKGQFLQQK